MTTGIDDALAALLPKPGVDLTRFHGMLAATAQHRAPVTPAERGKGNQHNDAGEGQEQTPAERRASMMC